MVKDILSGYCITYITRTEGSDKGNSRQCFRVPAGLDTKAYVSLVSEGWGSIPDCIPPLSRAAEKQIVLALITKLNSSFDVGLSTDPKMERTKDEMRELRMEQGAKKLVALVGASHAARLADLLLENDMQLCSLTQPGWKASKRTVELVAGELACLDPPADVVVLQCLDNSAYFCLNEDGTLTLPERSLLDGKFHIKEDLRISSQEQTLNLIRILSPIITAVPGAEIILITCIPRYIQVPCCTDHCKWTADKKARLMTDLSAMKRNIRSQLFMEKLVDPMTVCNLGSTESYTDGVHLTRPEYEKLAKVVIELVAGQPQEDLQQNPANSQLAKRPRLSTGGQQLGVGRGGEGEAAGAASIAAGAPGRRQFVCKK